MDTKRSALVAAVSIAAILPMRSAGAANAPAVMPGDDDMTCEQIATELTPYMQQMMPLATATAKTGQELKERGEKRAAEEMPAAAALTAAAIASSADPTGISGRAVGQAEIAHQQELWQRSLAEDKPLADKYKAQSSQLAAQGQQMQLNPRLQRLMQLMREKQCGGGGRASRRRNRDE